MANRAGRRASVLIVASPGTARPRTVPGSVTRVRQDEGLVRLIALWARGTLYIDTISVSWRFDAYSGSFEPTADDRQPGTPEGRFVYAYNPDPNGPFRKGKVFRTKTWEAWTIVAPAAEVTTAEITIVTSDPSKIVTLGCAMTRNGVVVCTDGPRPDAVHCLADLGSG